MSTVYDYAKFNNWEGANTYPYKAIERDCRHLRDRGYKVLNGYKTIHGSEIVQALQQGTVAGSAYANNWQFYQSGVFDNCNQGQDPNHGVAIVGLTKNLDWIVKNSWGQGWGM